MAAENIPGKRLPPRQAAPAGQDMAAKKQAEAEKAAQVRGVASIDAMRDAIRQAAHQLPAFTAVPRVARLDAAGFRARAAAGMPFLVTGIVKRWPLAALTPHDLRDQFGHLPVRARVGDYVNTAFAPDRAMQDMLLRDYLDLAPPDGAPDLPPYVGNLSLR